MEDDEFFSMVGRKVYGGVEMGDFFAKKSLNMGYGFAEKSLNMGCSFAILL